MVKYEFVIKQRIQSLFENGHQELYLIKNKDGDYTDKETVRRFDDYVDGYNDGRYSVLNEQDEREHKWI